MVQHVVEVYPSDFSSAAVANFDHTMAMPVSSRPMLQGMHRVLAPHPAAPCAALEQVSVALHRDAADWCLHFEFRGNVDALSLPAEGAGERRDGLWRDTCCELFVRLSGERYLEFNFSPSGAWNAYAFDRYREGMKPLRLEGTVRIASRRGPRQWTLDARIAGRDLAVEPAHVLIALCAIVRERDGTMSYWALRHPTQQPDFHHEQGFEQVKL